MNTSQPPPAAEAGHHRQIERTIDDLAHDYGDGFDRAEVETVYRDTYAALERQARVAAFLPVLAQQHTRQRLDERRPAPHAKRPVILFACVHNSGRSVAAQVLMRHDAGDRVEVRSAGSEPGEGVNPVVAQVLAERGLPVADHRPTLLDWDLVHASDVVITMGCGETCPVFPGKRYEDWTVDDPTGQDIDSVRRIVDDIETRVRQLLAEVAPAPVQGARA